MRGVADTVVRLPRLVAMGLIRAYQIPGKSLARRNCRFFQVAPSTPWRRWNVTDSSVAVGWRSDAWAGATHSDPGGTTRYPYSSGERR